MTTIDQRCPHDGGACHHACATSVCFRKRNGMSLTTPHPGFPVEGTSAVPAKFFTLPGTRTTIVTDPHTGLTTITCVVCGWSFSDKPGSRSLHAEHEYHLATTEKCRR